MAKSNLIICIFFFFTLVVKGQLIISPDTTICVGSATLEVLSAPSHGTDSYTVTSIPYTTETHAGTNAFPTGLDDISTSAISIGFTFCFFGNTYTNCYISTNGWMSFSNPPTAWNTVYGPGGTPSYSLPNTNSNVPKNCIMGPWQDWYPNYVSTVVKYQTLGTAPYRRFVVSFQDIQLFSCFASATGSFQMVIYETTNIIENHIIYKENCTGYEGGKATQAIHNIDGTVSYEVSGRDASAWTADEESWAYIPEEITWYIGPTLVGTGDSLIVSPATTTTYTAVLIACDGTTYSEDVTVSIEVPEDPAFTYPSGIGPTSFCLDGSSVLPDFIATSGGVFSTTPAGIVINTSTGEIDLDLSSAGTYTINYTVGISCPGTASQTITLFEIDDATFSYATDTYCATGTATPTFIADPGGLFTVSPSGLTINSSTGLITLSTGTEGTTYTITYITDGTCNDTSTFDITIEPFEDATFSYDAASYCPTGTALPIITGTSGGTFTVSPATITINASTGELDLSTGDVGTLYSITYTTSGYCDASSVETVLIDPLDDPTFGYSDPSYCPTGTVSPTFVTTSGGTFSVTPADLSIDFLTGEIDLTTGTIGSTYAITYTTPDGPCQNEATETVFIDSFDDPSFSYSSLVYCEDATATPTAIATSGGTFSVSPSDLSINASTGFIDFSTGIVGSSYTITYTTPAGLCQSSSSISILISPIIDANFYYPSNTYCNTGNEFPIVDNPGGSFTAEMGIVIDPLTGEIDFEASSPGGPFDVYYTSNGCSETDTFQITILANPIVSIEMADHICLESSTIDILVDPIGGVFTGSGTSGSTFNPSLISSAGFYLVSYTYTDSNGCSTAASTTIEVIQNNVDAGPDVSIFEAQSVTLSAEGGASFLWEPPSGLNCTGCQNTIASPAITTLYQVTSVDEYGCVGTDDVLVTVILVFDSTVFVPNTFTPNGDNINDYLFAFGSDIALIKSMHVYDRWGEEIWFKENLQNTDYTEGWDGTSKGTMAGEGVYAWVVIVELSNGANLLKKGNTTLLR